MARLQQSTPLLAVLLMFLFSSITSVTAAGYKPKQLTKKEYLSRLERKRSFQQLPARQRLAPRQSSTPARSCDSADTGTGYAEYINYNVPVNNLGNTNTATRNASACAALCDSLGSTCIGFSFGSNVPFYSNGPACQPKQNAASSAARLTTDTNWSTWLQGSCGEYSSSTSATCCNSRAYSTCTGTTGLSSGYSRYVGYNSANYDLGGFVNGVTTESQCQSACNNNSSCTAYAFTSRADFNNGPLCALKQGTEAQMTQLLRDTRSSTTVWTFAVRGGNCGDGAAHTAATCCQV